MEKKKEGHFSKSHKCKISETKWKKKKRVISLSRTSVKFPRQNEEKKKRVISLSRTSVKFPRQNGKKKRGPFL